MASGAGEIGNITVLFTDVVGSTVLSQSLSAD